MIGHALTANEQNRVLYAAVGVAVSNSVDPPPCCPQTFFPMQSPTTLQVAHVPPEVDVARSTIRKLDRRFLLLLAGVTFLSYVDRSGVVYAANDLCTDLKLTHGEYGNGVSLFYVGYLLSELAGNVMLQRFGAPAWISFIVFAWGFIGAAHGFIQNAAHFYVLRFASGVAHGGVFPAVWYIIPMFYPSKHVTNAYSVIFAAISFAMPIVSPISAGLLRLGPCVNVKGWRLVVFLGGIMTMMYTVVIYLFLPATPETASFLVAEEKEWIAVNQGKQDKNNNLSFWEEMRKVVSNGTWWLSTACCLISFGIDSILIFWTTLIIHGMLYGDGDGDTETCGSKHGSAALAVVMTAIPYLVCGVFCLWTRRLVVRNRPRVAAIVYTVGGVLMISWIGTSHIVLVVRLFLLTGAITVGYVSFCYMVALAITSCDASIQGVAASANTSVATIGAIAFPIIFGKLTDVLGSSIAVSVVGGSYLVAALLIARVEDPLMKKNVDRPNEDSAHTQASSSSA